MVFPEQENRTNEHTNSNKDNDRSTCAPHVKSFLGRQKNIKISQRTKRR